MEKIKNVFNVRVTKIDGPEREILKDECYLSRTNAIKAMRKYFEEEKQKWLKECDYLTESDFEYFEKCFTNDGGHISYGWSRESIEFENRRLKICD